MTADAQIAPRNALVNKNRGKRVAIMVHARSSTIACAAMDIKHAKLGGLVMHDSRYRDAWNYLSSVAPFAASVLRG
ncbi:MAG: hypothetical protein AABZ67_01440 [Pseudomonadota bacterium]